MALSESLIHTIPSQSDFSVAFSGITKNGVNLDFGLVGQWRFVLASGIGLTPTVIKINPTGNLVTHAAYTISTGTRVVTVFVSGVEISNYVGDLYTQLYAETSGNRITHLSQYFTTTVVVPPS